MYVQMVISDKGEDGEITYIVYIYDCNLNMHILEGVE